jgi:lipopolysaccharide transport system permease protein
LSEASLTVTHTAQRAGHLASANFGMFGLNMWRHRELLRHLISRNIRMQYKQSILGYAWILVNPLTQLLTLAFIFSVVFPSPPMEGASFTLFLFVGLLPWIFFSNAVLGAVDSIIGGASLVTAVYFPREILVVAAILVRFVDLIAGLIILVALILITGQAIGLATLWLPLLFLLHFIFISGLSLPLAALNLYFHDIRYLVGVVIYLWFFLTPIFYPLSQVPERFMWIYRINPNARLIETYRYALIDNISPPLGSVAIIAVLAVASLAIGYFIFKKLEGAFADYI